VHDRPMSSAQRSVNDLIVRAHHAALCVQDFDAARDFHVRVLGFEVEDELDRRCEPALGAVVGAYSTTCAPQVLRGGRTKAVYLLAPEGSVVELIEFPQRASS